MVVCVPDNGVPGLPHNGVPGKGVPGIPVNGVPVNGVPESGVPDMSVKTSVRRLFKSSWQTFSDDGIGC